MKLSEHVFERRRRRERATEYIGFGFRDTTGHYPRAAVTAYLTYSISFLGSGEFCGVFLGGNEKKRAAVLACDARSLRHSISMTDHYLRLSICLIISKSGYAD